jgi:hypothetical protein
MTAEELKQYPRKTAQQLLVELPGGRDYEKRTEIAVECALNLEWWRGYHAAKAELASPGQGDGDSK